MIVRTNDPAELATAVRVRRETSRPIKGTGFYFGGCEPTRRVSPGSDRHVFSPPSVKKLRSDPSTRPWFLFLSYVLPDKSGRFGSLALRQQLGSRRLPKWRSVCSWSSVYYHVETTAETSACTRLFDSVQIALRVSAARIQ
jgi:hypothetical protein